MGLLDFFRMGKVVAKAGTAARDRRNLGRFQGMAGRLCVGLRGQGPVIRKNVKQRSHDAPAI